MVNLEYVTMRAERMQAQQWGWVPCTELRTIRTGTIIPHAPFLSLHMFITQPRGMLMHYIVRAFRLLRLCESLFG